MLETYYGTLQDNTVEWDDDTPPVAGNERVKVMVTLLEEDAKEVSGKAMAAALASVAAMPLRTRIEFPVAWQREMRQDRVLPGRE
jgi:hypothetical protein